MNEQNLDYLNKQIKFTGFGEGHQEELKTKMQKQTPDFTIVHQQEFGKDNINAYLQFRKSADSDMYFLNKYDLQLKNGPQPDGVKQTFYLSNKEDNITLKEAYNLLSGRSVNKELTTKEGEKYKAWVQLDFKNMDKNGQYEVKKFHQNYGFDLDKTLSKLPIKELQNDVDKSKLMDSLQRGNRQSVTLQQDGKAEKVFIEASPQFKSLNMYDSSMKRINAPAMYEKKGEKEATKMEVKKEAGKSKAGEEDEEGPKQTQKKTRKKRQGIS